MSDAELSRSKKIKGPLCREGSVLLIHQKLIECYHNLVGNGSDRHQRDLKKIMQISGWIVESLMILPCLSLQGSSGVLLSQCRYLNCGNVARLPIQ